MKKRAKKICSAFLGTLIIISSLCIGFTAQAATLPIFTVSSASQVRPGDTVSVTVSVNENAGYCAGEFLLDFDSDILTPVSVKKGNAASEYFVSNAEYGDGKVFFAVISTELMSSAGTVATVTFTANEGTMLYSGEIGLTVSSLVGNISVGYGLNSVKSTANGGDLHVARQVLVPDAEMPEFTEQLSVTEADGGYVLGGSTFENLTQTALGSNFGSLKVEYLSKNETTLDAAAKLTTGCKIKLFVGEKLANTLIVSVTADVNGDYKLDGEDAFLASLVASGMITADELGAAQSNAADADSNGIIDEKDVRIMEANGLK